MRSHRRSRRVIAAAGGVVLSEANREALRGPEAHVVWLCCRGRRPGRPCAQRRPSTAARRRSRGSAPAAPRRTGAALPGGRRRHRVGRQPLGQRRHQGGAAMLRGDGPAGGALVRRGGGCRRDRRARVVASRRRRPGGGRHPGRGSADVVVGEPIGRDVRDRLGRVGEVVGHDRDAHAGVRPSGSDASRRGGRHRRWHGHRRRRLRRRLVASWDAGGARRHHAARHGRRSDRRQDRREPAGGQEPRRRVLAAVGRHLRPRCAGDACPNGRCAAAWARCRSTTS